MLKRELQRLALELLSAMSEQGPIERLDALDRIERDCAPEQRKIIVRARQLVRNGI